MHSTGTSLSSAIALFSTGELRAYCSIHSGGHLDSQPISTSAFSGLVTLTWIFTQQDGSPDADGVWRVWFCLWEPSRGTQQPSPYRKWIRCIDSVDAWSESEGGGTASATTQEFNQDNASFLFPFFFFLSAFRVCKKGLFIIIQGQSWLKVIKPCPSITLAFQPVTGPSVEGHGACTCVWEREMFF